MSKYRTYTTDQLEEHFSNFLMDSWSYSKVSSFSRNEKDFEKTYIYRETGRKSASTIAGNAYHDALCLFFSNLKNGIETSVIDMELQAFAYIDSIPANDWKIQKTTPTVENCREQANKVDISLIRNFLNERSVYMEEIGEILGVEMKFSEWVRINGVDIPLPCHAVIDLLVKLNNGKTVIIDHKSKASYTDEKDIKFSIGKQAITYVKAYEARFHTKVDEVWFMENKYSKNSDKSPQLRKHAIVMDHDSEVLYESMLYESLKRMIEAVANPDYVYLINDNDNFVDKAELYEFWAKTMIAEIDSFNIPENKKPLIAERLRKIRDASIINITPRVLITFRKNAASFIQYDLSFTDMTNTEKIEHILRTFNISAKVAHEIDGYSSNTYLLEVSAGVKIGNIMNYRLDIANALNVSSVRINKDLVIYQEKSYLSIESGKKRDKDLLFSADYLRDHKIPIGVDNYGRTIHWNLDNHSTPHMLICGATGSGKSVCIKSTIEYAKLAGIEDIYIFDPKYEFCAYGNQGAKVFNEINNIEKQMRLLVEEMQGRTKSGKKSKVLIIFDEFADAVQTAKSGPELDIKEEVQIGFYRPQRDESGELIPPQPKFEIRTTGRLKSLEENMKIILQKGRSLGFRVVAATQRASTKVITGDTKVNFPVLVCFRVPKEVDSKVVIDESGAETLCGGGDGLIRSPEYLDLVRFQGFYKP